MTGANHVQRRGRIEAVHGGTQLKHLLARKVGVEYGLVGQKADEPLHFHAVVKRVATVDQQLSVGSLENSHEEAEKGGLSCAVGAEEAADLTGWHRERDVFQGDFTAKRLRNSVNSYQWRLAHRSSARRPFIAVSEWR